MDKKPSLDLQVNIRIDPVLAERIEVYREANGMRGRADACRALLNQALGSRENLDRYVAARKKALQKGATS